MASSAELNSVWKHQRVSMIAKKNLPSYHLHSSSKCEEQQLKMKESISGISTRSKSVKYKEGKSTGERGVKDDELVKYMSKLPYYLQRMERGESFQGKALNVGVLDWTRLEKWKHNQKGGHKMATNSASVISTNSGGVPNKAPCNQTHHSTSYNGVHSASKDEVSGGFQSSVAKVRPTQGLKPASSDFLDGRKQTARKHKAPEINKTRVDPEKSRRTRSSQKATTSGVGDMSSDMRNSRISVGTKYSANALGGETKTRVGRTQKLDGSWKSSDKRNGADLGASSRMSSRYGTLQDLKGDRHAVDDKSMKREDGSKIDLTCRQFSDQRRNIILLRPRTNEGITLSEEPQMALDQSFIKPKVKSSYGDSGNQNVQFSELSSQSPCPRSLSPNSKNKPESSERSPRKNLSSVVSEPPECLDKSENESFQCKNSESTIMEARGTSAAERETKLNQETTQAGSGNYRHQTPSKRFSFSFSRISRSFSFKDEQSSGQQLSSTYAPAKSGPVRSDGSPCSDSSKLEKLPSQNRARASPLRRLLDPLLKQKGKGSVLPCKETPMSSNPKNEKQASTTMIRALVQLTIRNGLPLFQFVIDDETNSILAATMNNNAPPSEKGESSQCCTFYSVNEVKKKSGSWISHGNREKRCGFEYNIIGRMKLCNSPCSVLINQNCDIKPIARESVLFETELKVDQEPEKLKTCRELAAVVIKTYTEINYKDLCWSFEENVDEFSTTVVLPGGVHSFPEEGMPSSLIDRWRTGGLCDCGGWDVGCKLRVISNHKTFQSLSNASKSQPHSYIFQLFEQEEDQQNNPVFRMVPLKSGIYSVEFRSSISHLQAFHISVTVITCKISPDFSEINTVDSSTNSNIRGNREMPVKYASHPPLSPVGRV